jgi:hypothetical protein
MRYFFLLCGIILLSGSFVAPASAATITLSSATTTLHVGDVVTVTVSDDTEHQLVNAVETIVTFPNDLLEFVSSDNSHSVLSLWIKEPTIENTHDIHFAGVAPGGFTQSDATLVKLTFKVIHTGTADMTLGQTKNLLNDSAGTEVTTVVRNLRLSVEDGQSVIVPQLSDTELPEPFTPIFVFDPDVYDGADTLVFSTLDKGSGVDHFEVKEGLFGLYTRAVSPYHIKDQSRSKQISIKAIDHSGNVRVEIFYPQNWRPWYKQTQILGGIVVGCLLVLWVLFIVVRKLLVRVRFSS